MRADEQGYMDTADQLLSVAEVINLGAQSAQPQEQPDVHLWGPSPSSGPAARQPAPQVPSSAAAEERRDQAPQ
eukprot:8012344-Alexandrium_andersonii.AAC.1